MTDDLSFTPNGPHDLAGQVGTHGGLIDREEHDLPYWERRVDAMSRLLMSKGILLDFAEIRAGIEALTPEDYEKLGYFERWAKSFRRMLVNKGVLTNEEIDSRIAEMKSRLEQGG
ncbi:SH3-like domain-containing protein [Futiania mangrovi]|uniref:Nitrile hydratase subunit beta n=1 Tax=Futiania mangrovi TaxID=2959716 RepID=A0A9J6PHR0_9PROT|nr:SH3-like domain-containing protein [Futiania mangrovii]MCP1337352.1 nitrile hydratase subunit beta [Futiania mangrovii]